MTLKVQRLTFSDFVSALGVLFDLSRTREGVVMVDNTCKRKEDLNKLIADTLKQGSLDCRRALELRGKLASADAQVMDLAGRYAFSLPLDASDIARCAKNRPSCLGSAVCLHFRTLQMLLRSLLGSSF